MMRFAGILALLLVPLAAADRTSVSVRDLDGNARKLMPTGAAQVLFFVMTDCPISNSYAPEIQNICGDYAAKGASCALVYEDVEASPQSLRKHLKDFQYRNISAIFDADRKAASAVNATVTPQAVLIDHDGKVRYRGRIDNFYADLGKPRRQATTHDLRDALDAVLSGKPVATPETKAVGCYIVSPEALK